MTGHLRLRIVPLTLREANDFVERWHRHSARTSNDGGKFAIGLRLGDVLVGPPSWAGRSPACCRSMARQNFCGSAPRLMLRAGRHRSSTAARGASGS